MMGLQTKNTQAEQAREVLMDTLRRFVEDGPSEDELTAAKQNITGGFPLRIASNSKIVEYLAVIGFYSLPLDYLDTFNARVDAVTSAQIREAFARRLQLDKFAKVVVGPSEGEKMAASNKAEE
jgi:zinc protease